MAVATGNAMREGLPALTLECVDTGTPTWHCGRHPEYHVIVVGCVDRMAGKDTIGDLRSGRPCGLRRWLVVVLIGTGACRLNYDTIDQAALNTSSSIGGGFQTGGAPGIGGASQGGAAGDVGIGGINGSAGDVGSSGAAGASSG